ncbi:MAG TPA: flagellar hook capping FlgD N-terminal domain-containing protein [Capsulimonadaceae bacterium]|jgi:flagellar basal-body rod modification protein FlgD
MSTTSTTYTQYTGSTNTNAGGAATKKSGSNLTQADFLNLLTTQLQNQDPLNPQSNTEFASQMAQYSSLTQMQNLNTTLSQQTSFTQMSSAASMLGKSVTTSAYDSDGKAISGTVSSVGLTSSGSITLSVGGSTINLSDVTGIVQSS